MGDNSLELPMLVSVQTVRMETRWKKNIVLHWISSFEGPASVGS